MERFMKSKFMIFCLLALCSGTHLSAGKLDYGDQDIVSDDMARYTHGTSITKLAKIVDILDLEERQEVDTLILKTNLLGVQALREIIEKVLPLLPNLRQIDLSFTVIKETGLGDILSLLRKFPNLQYINLWGNGVADAIPEFLDKGEDKEGIKARVMQKVIIYPKNLVEAESPPRLPTLLERFPQWRDAHRAFYNHEAEIY